MTFGQCVTTELRHAGQHNNAAWAGERDSLNSSEVLVGILALLGIVAAPLRLAIPHFRFGTFDFLSRCF